MARRGENIYKRKDGRWEGRFIKEYDLMGKAHFGYIYGHSYSEVKLKLREAQNKGNEPCVLTNKDISYENILKLWLTAAQINLKESSYARYYHLLECHIIPRLGKYPVSKISTTMVEQYINELLCNGRMDGHGGLSPKSVSDILTIIKSSMFYARRNDFCVICNLERLSVKKESKEMRVLSIEEQERLKHFLLTDTDTIKFGVLLSLYTGIRIGELCALRWEHIKLAAGILEIRETLQRVQNVTDVNGGKTRIIITTPKSKCSIRDIPIPKYIQDLAAQFENLPGAYVLTGEQSCYIEPRTLQNKFKQYTKQCDVIGANYHSLRHTFATRCMELGFEVKSLSEILGHANVNITLNRYVHSSLKLKKDNMEKLNATLF